MATPWQIRHAVQILKSGGVIAYPTETVYGLGCDPLDPYAVEHILELKHRPVEKGLILIGAELAHLHPFIDVNDPTLLEKIADLSQPPTTWVCPTRQNIPTWLCGRHQSIAVRITRHPVAQSICRQLGGAIVSTSANPATLPPARSALKSRCYFGNRLNLIICETLPPAAKPSRIIDLLSGEVIRA